METRFLSKSETVVGVPSSFKTVDSARASRGLMSRALSEGAPVILAADPQPQSSRSSDEKSVDVETMDLDVGDIFHLAVVGGVNPKLPAFRARRPRAIILYLDAIIFVEQSLS